LSAWSKTERWLATMAGESPDRPPVALWRHFPGDDQDGPALAAAHLRWQADYDWDLIKVSPSSSYCLVDWGAEARWEGNTEGTRVYTKRVIEHPDDWAKLPVLDPRRGMLAEQIAALKMTGEGLRAADDETPYLATIFSPLAQAKNLAGPARLLAHMRSHPDAVREGLATITRSTIHYVAAAKEAGVSGIFYAIQHASYRLLSQVEYLAMGRTYDEEILASAADLWLNMVHLHGDDDIMFDLIADYPVQIINWHDRDSGISLAEGLKQTPAVVSGGVSRWTLYQDGPEGTVAEARDALEQTGGRRLLLAVGCVAMTNAPLRNIRALRQAVEPS
jgi:uroporphyrinogen decarboxylase